MMDFGIHDGFRGMAEEGRGKYQKRPLEMLAFMLEGGALDRHKAEKLFGVTPEVAYRLLELLEDVIPAVRRRKRGRIVEFYFDATTLRRRPLADERTVGFATALAASFASAFSRVFGGTKYERELRTHREQVVGALSEQRRSHFGDIGRKVYVRCGQEELLGDKEVLLEDVLDAVLRQRVVQMRYQRFSGRVDQLTIKPYTLAVYDAHLYVVSATDDEPYYPFRFARIQEFDVTSESFDYPTATEYDPDVAFRDSIGIFVDPDPCLVRVKLDATWAVYARHHRWHHSQKIEKSYKDGTLLLQMHVRPCNELEIWLLGLGEHAEVLEPESLREKIAARLTSASARYKSALKKPTERGKV